MIADDPAVIALMQTVMRQSQAELAEWSLCGLRLVSRPIRGVVKSRSLLSCPPNRQMAALRQLAIDFESFVSDFPPPHRSVSPDARRT
jgi:hypothetical protein